MTLYNIIEKIYARYSTIYDDEDQVDFDEMRQEIIHQIEVTWPDIENTEGISFEYDGLYFDVMLDDDLKQEFYDKYPEALL